MIVCIKKQSSTLFKYTFNSIFLSRNIIFHLFCITIGKTTSINFRWSWIIQKNTRSLYKKINLSFKFDNEIYISIFIKTKCQCRFYDSNIFGVFYRNQLKVIFWFFKVWIILRNSFTFFDTFFADRFLTITSLASLNRKIFFFVW